MKPPLPPQDELVARLRVRDEAAFTLILDRWSGGMLRVARSFVTTPESAADLVQDAWLAVVAHIDRFEGRASLKTWIYRILVNAARRRAVQEGRMVAFSSLDDSGPTVAPERFQCGGEPYPGHWRTAPAPWVLPGASPEQRALTAELRAVLDAAVADLPSRQRVVLTLRDIEGCDAQEVCAILDITAVNQRVHLHRARAAVRDRLEVYLDERA